MVDNVVRVVVVLAVEEAGEVADHAGGDEGEFESASETHGVRVAGRGEESVAEAASAFAVGGVAAFADVVGFGLGGAAPADLSVFFLVGGAEVAVGAGLALADGGVASAFGAGEVEGFEGIAGGRAAAFGAGFDFACDCVGDGAAAYAVVHAGV